MKKTLLGLLFGGSLLVGTAQNCSTIPFSVVEMFTSQGCNSCPPAEALIDNFITAEKNSGRNVVIVNEHVTYWDYLGWVDPFGNASFKARQLKYVQTINGNNTYYTPQVFVNGELICGSTGCISNAINNYLGAGNEATAGVCLSLNSSPDASALTIGYEISGTYGASQLILMLVEDNLTTHVTAGENAGLTLVNNSVARTFLTVNIANGGVGTTSLAVPANSVRANCRVMAFLQDPNTMKMAGGTKGFSLYGATGVEKNASTGVIGLYPNPASTSLTVNVSEQVSELKLIDVVGNTVYAEKLNISGLVNHTINISNFSNGVYFVQTIDGMGIVSTKRMVIQH